MQLRSNMRMLHYCVTGKANDWDFYLLQNSLTGLLMKEMVVVWEGEEPIEVSITQKSKSVWIARGAYMGKDLEVKGSSSRSALAHWYDAAHYRGG